MMDLKVILPLGILVILVIALHKEDPRMTKLKTSYYQFMKIVPDKYSVLRKPVIVTGTYRGDIGTNVNKGAEIFICIDGSLNDNFHVLLHELAHSTVTEYDHTDHFWNNFTDLRNIAKSKGMYVDTPQKAYCGKTIGDT